MSTNIASLSSPPTAFDPVYRIEKKKERKVTQHIIDNSLRYPLQKQNLKKALDKYNDIPRDLREEYINELDSMPGFNVMNGTILAGALALFFYTKDSRSITPKLYKAQIARIIEPIISDNDPEMIERTKIDILRYARHILAYRLERFNV